MSLSVFTHVALAALAAAGAWAFQGARMDAAVAEEKLKASDHVIQQISVAAAQRTENRKAADQAAYDAAHREAAMSQKLKGARRELWTATENLATCRLSAGAVRVLNDAARGPGPGAGADRPAAR